MLYFHSSIILPKSFTIPSFYANISIIVPI